MKNEELVGETKGLRGFRMGLLDIAKKIFNKDEYEDFKLEVDTSGCADEEKIPC